MTARHCLLSLLFGCAAAAPATAKSADPVTGVRLYALDCGSMSFTNMGLFSDTDDYDGKTGSIVDPCFVIRHPKGILLWDLGLGDAYIGRNDPPNADGVSMQVRATFLGELASIGIAPADVTFLAFSHFHMDHTGNANLFTTPTWIVSQAELDWALGSPTPPVVVPSTFSAVHTVHTRMIAGDYDVFQDGTVRILKAPGHTPGSQVLLIKLAHTGPVVLSGDLYHVRSDRPHDGSGARLMRVNSSRSDSLASVDRVETLLKNLHARLIIQHDPQDFAALPVSPAYLD
jgi:glyoxylase-like metal-dependent hydrolase (beta-lactamase superfamily II)